MRDIFFWKVWSASERRMAVIVLLLLVAAIGFFGFHIIHPLNNVVRWNVLSEMSDIGVFRDVLKISTWQYSIPIPSHMVTERFVASVMEINPASVYIFWILAVAGLSLILAAVTNLPRFWYLATMIILIFFLMFARLEVLNVAGEGNRTLFLIAVILFAGTSYYIHAFRPDFGIAIRIGLMFLICLVMTGVIAGTSEVAYPALTVASYTFPFWMLLTAVFLIISATEIMAGFVWLSTHAAVNRGSGLMQFIIISVLYLVLLLLIFLKNTRQIDWDVTLVSPIYLALLSGILGIWGFRKRADSTGGVVPFRGTAFWLYIGLFMVALAFTGYIAATANDPVLETLEDLVIQGQLAMSVLFLFYILVNFWPLFRQRLAVHKVLYKPMRFGLTQTRLFGFAGLIILFFVQKLLPVNQAIAGYFNGLGDLHTLTKEYALAEEYYKLALQQEFQNHKSNYALASLALKQGDNTTAAYYFRQALLKNPSPQAYAGLTGILTDENLFFDAMHSLKEGLRSFPENGELLNNLGMLYSKTSVADSAYYFLEKSKQTSRRPEIAATNLLAFLSKSSDAQLTDSLAGAADQYDYISWKANWLALRNQTRQYAPVDFDKKTIPADSALSVSAFAYLYNYSINQARFDEEPAGYLLKLAGKNPVLSSELSFAALYTEFYGGNKLKALETLSAWAEEDGDQRQLYHKILGHWLLQLQLYAKAIEIFSEVEGPDGTLGVAVASALSGQKEVATVLLDKIGEKPEVIQQLKQAIFSGTNPVFESDSLLVAAKRAPTDAAFEKAIRANPFEEEIVTAASDYFKRKKQISKAYQIVVDALRYNDVSGKIWGQYALLSLDQGLIGQGDEGEANARKYALPADYQQFAARYQPMRALIEKQRAEFQ